MPHDRRCCCTLFGWLILALLLFSYTHVQAQTRGTVRDSAQDLNELFGDEFNDDDDDDDFAAHHRPQTVFGTSPNNNNDDDDDDDGGFASNAPVTRPAAAAIFERNDDVREFQVEPQRRVAQLDEDVRAIPSPARRSSRRRPMLRLNEMTDREFVAVVRAERERRLQARRRASSSQVAPGARRSRRRQRSRQRARSPTSSTSTRWSADDVDDDIEPFTVPAESRQRSRNTNVYDDDDDDGGGAGSRMPRTRPRQRRVVRAQNDNELRRHRTPDRAERAQASRANNEPRFADNDSLRAARARRSNAKRRHVQQQEQANAARRRLPQSAIDSSFHPAQSNANEDVENVRAARVEGIRRQKAESSRQQNLPVLRWRWEDETLKAIPLVYEFESVSEDALSKDTDEIIRNDKDDARTFKNKRPNINRMLQHGTDFKGTKGKIIVNSVKKQRPIDGETETFVDANNGQDEVRRSWNDGVVTRD